MNSRAAGGIRVKLTKEGRARLRRSGKLTAKLTTTVSVGSRARVELAQKVTFRKVNLSRVASRGLRFVGRCPEPCSMAANLLMRASDARRYGLRPPSSAPVPVARATARAATTTNLVLKPGKASAKAMRRARRLKMTFEAVVSGLSGPSQNASHVLTLRR